MKKIIVIVALILGLASLGIFFRKESEEAFKNVFYYSPCDAPLEFTIGSIDSRFQVTRAELLADSRAAANIWSNTQGKQLFVYKPDAALKINMVYDDRQELTSKINDLDSDLKQKQGEIDPKIAAFKKKQSEFENRVNSLNEKISYWNSKGGAPKEEYDKLVAEQKSLKSEAAILNATAEELGQSTLEYNAGAQKLNQTIDDYKEVLEFKPEEGLYEQDGSEKSISIYIDVNASEFLHTLAHEMGHALGLDHQNDPKAIMYPQTTTILSPTQVEVAQLSEICKKRTIFEVALTRFQEIIEVLKERVGSKVN
ncbi:MAG: matrixin family metalloprotease [Candidatus Levybacteria bacterium]|nr:matrixin family metalloprotease [Candidatus Levybacteria bacterium]